MAALTASAIHRARVLMLAAEAYGSPGGIAQFNRHLLDGLSRRPDLAVRALGFYGGTGCGEPDAIAWRAPARGGKAGYAARALAEAARFRPHLIICGVIGFGALSVVAARVSGARLWSVTHGWEAWTPQPLLDTWGLRRSDLITSVSRFTRDKLLSWSGIEPERVKLLPNTIDLARFKPGPRPEALARRYGVGDAKVLLTTGRLAAIDRYKGQDRVVRLLDALERRVGPVRYIIAGDGDDRPRLERLARETGQQDRVLFVGYVPDEEVEDLYRLADVFVMPSTGEGFGIVYLEAMACGCPVVAGNRDGSVDALAGGELGRLVDPDDAQALLGAIEATLREGRRRDARIPGVERFALPQFYERVGELADEVAGPT